jgi:transposase-like protein
MVLRKQWGSEVKQTFLKKIDAGHSVSQAAKELGVPATTAWTWNSSRKDKAHPRNMPINYLKKLVNKKKTFNPDTGTIAFDNEGSEGVNVYLTPPLRVDQEQAYKDAVFKEMNELRRERDFYKKLLMEKVLTDGNN